MFRTNEVEDVAGSIRHAKRTAQFISDDPQAWKWTILALHSALQGACVCHLTTTARPLGSVRERNSREWSAYIEASRTDLNVEVPNTYLMELPELLRAVRKPNSAGGGGDNPCVAINDSELAWLDRFHKNIRNPLVHFEPKGWSIEVSGVPEIANLIVRIIEEILEIGWAFRHQTSTQREDMQQSLQGLAAVKWPI